MSLQKSHGAINNAQHDLNITVVAENIRTPENLGMILRVSEAFGVHNIYFVGTLGVSFTIKAKRAARNTHSLNNFEFVSDSQQLVNKFRASEAKVVALEITNFSQPIHHFKFKDQQPLVILIGSEREGLSEELLSLAEESVHIEMYGKNSSLNVVNALSIALHQLVTNQT